MLIRYFDSSALAKRYAREPGSRSVDRLLSSGSAATSRLSEIELASALARWVREGVLQLPEHHRALEAMRRDILRFIIVELEAKVAERAQELLARYTLRAGDAIQLASCLVLEAELDRSLDFVTFDARLRHAATLEGLRVLPRRLPRSP